jgi:hypothetical protein
LLSRFVSADSVSVKIGEALPGIFKKSYPVLDPGTQLLVVASLLRFHEIDALPLGVKQNQRGRLVVGGYSLLSRLMAIQPKEYRRFLELPCERASLDLARTKVNDSLEGLLDIFSKTRFGFAWVESHSGIDGGFVSLRDLLELHESGFFETELNVAEVASSPVMSLPLDSTLKATLHEMFFQGFRRMFVSGSDGMVTDRSIISHVFSSSNLLETSEKPETLLDATLGDLEKTRPVPVSSDISLKEAAVLMKDALEECLVCDDGLLTPWDLIMKPYLMKKLTIKGESGLTNKNSTEKR